MIENKKEEYQHFHAEIIMRLDYLSITFLQTEEVQSPKSVRRQKRQAA